VLEERVELKRKRQGEDDTIGDGFELSEEQVKAIALSENAVRDFWLAGIDSLRFPASEGVFQLDRRWHEDWPLRLTRSLIPHPLTAVTRLVFEGGSQGRWQS